MFYVQKNGSTVETSDETYVKSLIQIASILCSQTHIKMNNQITDLLFDILECLYISKRREVWIMRQQMDSIGYHILWKQGHQLCCNKKPQKKNATYFILINIPKETCDSCGIAPAEVFETCLTLCVALPIVHLTTL